MVMQYHSRSFRINALSHNHIKNDQEVFLRFCWQSLFNEQLVEHFLWDMNSTKLCNGFYIQFRQSFTKKTFSYDEHLKS